MNRLQQQVAKARRSGLHRWLLNRVLLHTVPFNKPHGLRVVDIGADGMVVAARNRRSNRNHIGGIHACLLATLCEYVSGLSLLLKLDPRAYRIILKSICMTYHYQAKKDVTAAFSLPEDIFQQEVLIPLQQGDAIFRECEVEVYDTDRNHICTGKINWQIKPWDKVRTKS